METGHFYFLSNDYFVDFPDPNLSQNKPAVDGKFHNRPCFYAFADVSTEICWMVPVSSKVEKYKREYAKKFERFGKCDTLAFGEILGREKAFLIQNLCPTTSKYITNEYIDAVAHVPVRLDGAFEKILIQKVKTVLTLTRQGKKLLFSDVLRIEKELKK
jgi:hypothetical protein